jgi:hypothetical protein
MRKTLLKFGAVGAFIATLAMPAAVFAASPAVVTPSHLHGWQQYETAGGNVSFVETDGAPLGSGALELDTPAEPDAAQFDVDRTHNPVALTNVGTMGYSLKSTAGAQNAAPAYILGIDLEGDGAGEPFYAYYEPAYNGATDTRNWGDYTINNTSKFWSFTQAGNLGGTNGANLFTLDDVHAQFPSATVVELTLSQGTGNTGWTTFTDNVRFEGRQCR